MRRTLPILFAALLAVPALAQTNQAPTKADAPAGIGLCTGGRDGVYFSAGLSISEAAGKSLPVAVIATAGSWENLAAVAEGSRCQAAIVQGDAPAAFARLRGAEARSIRRATALHREYAHVLCNRKAGVTDAYDLMDSNKRPLAVGPEGSGSWITEQNWAAVNKDFGKVPLIPEGGQIAAGVVADGTTAACMLFVAGLKSPAVNAIDASYGDALVMVPATGRLFRNAVNERGERLYEMEDVPAGTYPRLLPRGWLGGGSVEVPTVRAILVVNAAALGDARYAALMSAVGRARARILADAGEK